jgi:hypothetical protein
VLKKGKFKSQILEVRNGQRSAQKLAEEIVQQLRQEFNLEDVQDISAVAPPSCLTLAGVSGVSGGGDANLPIAMA